MYNHIMELKKAKRRWRIVFGIPIILGFLALGSLVLMLLWNSVVVDIFAIKAISFWQSLGLIIISKILFGGFHHHRSHPNFYDRRSMEKLRKWREEHFTEEKANSEENQA